VKLADIGARLLADTLRSWLNDAVQPQAQDATKATVTGLLKKDDGVIDWTRPAAQISRQVRAFNPWPGSYTRLAGEKLNIWRALPLDNDGRSTPGQVVAVTNGPRDIPIAVSTGDGLLGLVEVQREGRKRVPAADFARGVPGLIGSRLG
jgi:methionyl-tRNA formyltransferase